MNKFLTWIAWIINGMIRYDVHDRKFENVTDRSLFTENGVFYERNIRYSATNCEFIKLKEPEPIISRPSVYVYDNSLWDKLVDWNDVKDKNE